MTDGHCFISYSVADGLDFATKLFNKLEGGHPHIDAWLDKNRLKPGDDWDEQIAKAIADCKCLVFALSVDSVAEGSTCKQEWVWALKYKKPVVPLLIDRKAQLPFRLGSRQYIDFTSDFEAGLAKLRDHIAYLNSEEGKLDELKHRLEDAHRDLRRAKPEDVARVQADIDELKKQIETQEKIVANPEAAQKQTQANIEAGLERERKPQLPVTNYHSTKFINPPPGIAPIYFQDRMVETEQIVHFLQDDSQRLMTIVGRGGVGKTAMVCRLLKGLEGGELPDGLGKMRVEGIVYLSESGSHRVNFANLFYDLCKLLPADAANALDAVYKNPQASTASKMSALLDRFTAGKVVLLLDNVEPLISVETFDIADAELDECLRALLHGAHSALKVILTTRVAPRGLNLCEPGRQRVLTLDSGLEQKYAVEMLREMDVDAKVGLKAGTDEALGRACERTLGFPRALEALFAILASDRYTTLDELLAMPTPVNVVEALVGEAFNRLDTNAQKVMQALAVYNRPVTPAAVDYLLAPHLPAMDSAPILQRLANMHFARKESGRFYLHPVDREFAISLLAKGDEIKVDNSELTQLYRQMGMHPPHEERKDFTQLGLTDRAADYFAQARKPRAEWKKLDDLSAQLAEFDLRCAAGDYDTAASVLLEFDGECLHLWGHYRLMIEMHKIVTGKITDPLLRMGNLNSLGNAYHELGDARKSNEYFAQGISAAQDAKNRNAEGVFLGNLGNIYYSLADMNKAIEHYEQALVIVREIGDRKSEGYNLGNLGNAFATLGNTHKAIEYYEQALVIAREIGDRIGEGNQLGNIGSVYAGLGEALKAIEFHEQALVIAREIGDRKGEGNNLGNLGNRYANLGNTRKAIEYYEQVLVIVREIGDRSGEGVVLGNLGNSFADSGDSRKAIEYYEQALVIAREIGDRSGEAKNFGGIAACHHKAGELTKAIEYLTSALSIVQEIGEKNEVGVCLSILGSYYKDLDNQKQAKEYFEQSLAIAQETGYRYGEGFRLLNLADVEIELKSYERAIGLALQSTKIGDEISIPHLQGNSHVDLALAYILSENLEAAQKSIEAALEYDVPENNHNGSALHGIIALRQGDEVTARGAFVRAIGQADEILSKTAEYYSALDAKGLAICGLLICDLRLGRGDPSRSTTATDESRRVAPTVNDAIETFRKARKIAPHAGVVKSVLRLFDELVKCDTDGILKDVRAAVSEANQA